MGENEVPLEIFIEYLKEFRIEITNTMNCLTARSGNWTSELSILTFQYAGLPTGNITADTSETSVRPKLVQHLEFLKRNLQCDTEPSKEMMEDIMAKIRSLILSSRIVLQNEVNINGISDTLSNVLEDWFSRYPGYYDRLLTFFGEKTAAPRPHSQ